jgi:hypothetical protein
LRHAGGEGVLLGEGQGGKTMLGTNRQFDSLLRTLDQQIGMMEKLLIQGKSPAGLASSLEELWSHKRMLKLLLLNRRIEAAKPLVDFQRWRDGNGALYLCAAKVSEARRARS